MSIQKSKKELKNRTEELKTKRKSIEDVDKTYQVTLETIKTLTDAYIYLAFRYYLPHTCIKCGGKDSYSYIDDEPGLITCVKCCNTTKINKLPIKDVLLLARLIFYFKATNKGVDRIAEVFKIKKSKVLKCLWWCMQRFNDEGTRLINNTNRVNFISNEVGYIRLKLKLRYEKILLTHGVYQASLDN